MNLFKLVSNFQRKFFDRSVIYASAIFLSFLVLSIYLSVTIVIAKQPITKDYELFAITAFLHTTCFTLLFAYAIM